MSDESIAVVSRIPPSRGGGVLTSGTALVKNGLFLLQVVAAFGGSFVPAILGGLAAQHRWLPGPQEISFLPVLAGLGLTGLFMWLFIGKLLRDPWSSRYVYNKLRAAVADRGDALVDVNYPDAIFVEVIPRRNWGQLMLESADDHGFLLIDGERRQLLIEGDKTRYCIPGSALVSCRVELMNPSAANDPRATPFAIVVLNIRDDRVGEREVPLLPRRTVSGNALGGNYVERAHELERRILGLNCEAAEALGAQQVG
jgi:hypothetical protein